jgi:hypothetical protein
MTWKLYDVVSDWRSQSMSTVKSVMNSTYKWSKTSEASAEMCVKLLNENRFICLHVRHIYYHIFSENDVDNYDKTTTISRENVSARTSSSRFWFMCSETREIWTSSRIIISSFYLILYHSCALYTRVFFSNTQFESTKSTHFKWRNLKKNWCTINIISRSESQIAWDQY